MVSSGAGSSRIIPSVHCRQMRLDHGPNDSHERTLAIIVLKLKRSGRPFTGTTMHFLTTESSKSLGSRVAWHCSQNNPKAPPDDTERRLRRSKHEVISDNLLVAFFQHYGVFYGGDQQFLYQKMKLEKNTFPTHHFLSESVA